MQLQRREVFSNDVIFVDGLWGTGKSLLAPIVCSMTGVEKLKIEHTYEHVSWLFRLGKISEDAALWMLKTYADMGQYHNVIGRDINLRWNDDSGLKYVQDKLKLIGRLFSSEGDLKAEEINRKNLAYCVMTHKLLLAPDLLLNAYGSRVKVIEMVRHPLYMVDHYNGFLSRFNSVRNFTPSFYHEGEKVPWFAKQWAEEYNSAKPLEKAILCITRLYPWLFQKIDEAKKDGLEVLIISFEELSFRPKLVLSRLEEFTGRSHHGQIASVLKRQKLPRNSISQGRGHSSYGWSSSKSSDAEIYTHLRNKVKENCSEPLLGTLNETISWYNDLFPSSLADLENR